jgi:phosphate transport system ATP-binding protein
MIPSHISTSVHVSPIVEARDFSLFFGSHAVLKHLSFSFQPRAVTAIIGSSGCGKSTLLRSINRMNDFFETVKTQGKILVEGEDVYSPSVCLTRLRKRVGMVFQRPNPFPLSISDNVLYGLRVHKVEGSRSFFEGVVEEYLKAVLLWEEVKEKLRHSALSLSLEQQQRLCIARLLAVKPAILLMDEPCSALDPIATARVEELILSLKKLYTIIIVTHNMQQAARISDETGFMLFGELIEFAETGKIFTRPADSRTEEYVTGRFG